MKKLLIVLLSAMFVVSGFTFVFADDGGQDSVRARKAGASVTIGGDARARGTWAKEYDLDSTDADDDMRTFDSRLRLFVVGKAGNGIEARGKVTLSDGTWGTMDANGAADTAGVINSNYAYLHIPIGAVVVDAGRKERSFGKKFHDDYTSEARDTLEISTMLGDTGVGVFPDKVVENIAGIGDDNLEDTNNYGVYVNHSTGNLAVGALIVFESAKGAVDTDGTELVVYAATDIGNIGITGELAYTTGDIAGNENADGDAMMGAFVSASMPMGQMSVTGTVAYAGNGYVADSHFTPTVFVGTDNPTAIGNFGATLSGTPAADDTVLGVIATVNYDVNDDIGAVGRVAYLSLGGQSGKTAGDDASAFEIDLGASYKLSDNAKYAIDLGFLIPSDLTADDATAMALAHKVEVYL